MPQVTATGLMPGDSFIPGIQAARFGVGKATLARWAKEGIINRYGTTRKCLYLASEITKFLMTGIGVDGKVPFKKVASPLHKLHHPELYKDGVLIETEDSLPLPEASETASQ